MDYKTLLGQILDKAAAAEGCAEAIETPSDAALGDYAFPCFRLAKTMRMAPPKIAQELAQKIEQPAFIAKIEAVGPYINFFLDKAVFAENTLSTALEAGENYGRSDMGAGKTVVMDYSSINIAKPFHIGHLSTTALGNSLYRIYSFLGFTPVGINHLGDWGTQFGKLITAYKLWGEDACVDEGGIDYMMSLYARFHEEAEKNPALADEARAWFKKIEDGDEEALAIFQRFKDMTLREIGKLYDLLDVHFDSYAGESFYNDKMQPVIDELREKNLLVESEGAQVVELTEYDLPPCLILKRDGTTLYATRDLAAAFYRKNTYNFYKSLYIVAYQQNLHFKQLFAVIDKMGYSWAQDMEHVNFGMVSLADGSMSTRKGHVVKLKDVLEQAIAKTRALIEEKSPDLADKDSVANDIGVGAVVFSALSNGRIKDIVFDWDRVLNFDGETGPYVQYTHARCRSLLRKAGNGYDYACADYTALDNDDALAVLRQIESFPDAIVRAMTKNEPYLVTRHIVHLAQYMNKFYYDHRVIDDDREKTAARLMLAEVTANTIKTGLYLLGIKAPDRM